MFSGWIEWVGGVLDLIGVVERLDRDWPRFQYLTGIAEPLRHLNRNPYPGYTEIVADALRNQSLLSALRDLVGEANGCVVPVEAYEALERGARLLRDRAETLNRSLNGIGAQERPA